MFANMALDSSNNHLVFKYDPMASLKISPITTTIFSGPLTPHEDKPYLEEGNPERLNSSRKHLNQEVTEQF